MPANRLVFDDFHIHGASAPEWNQRYVQMSRGVMHSSLAEWSAGGVHVFRKWMSGRVVQQGALPRGRICIAMLGDGAPSGMRVQGGEFGDTHLLVLRGGDDFEFQRPAGVELLSIAFDAQDFMRWLHESPIPVTLSPAASILRAPADVLAKLRHRIRAQVLGAGQFSGRGLMRATSGVLAVATPVPPARRSSVAAAALVKRSHALALSGDGERALKIGELCEALDTSRRTLQASFNDVAGMKPLAYLRNVRLDAVRRRLSAGHGEVSVSTAAIEAGFDHFGRFAGDYKALFGESPSQTRASCAPIARGGRPAPRVRPGRKASSADARSGRASG